MPVNTSLSALPFPQRFYCFAVVDCEDKFWLRSSSYFRRLENVGVLPKYPWEKRGEELQMNVFLWTIVCSFTPILVKNQTKNPAALKSREKRTLRNYRWTGLCYGGNHLAIWGDGSCYGFVIWDRTRVTWTFRSSCRGSRSSGSQRVL